jgi:hypothetical protein
MILIRLIPFQTIYFINSIKVIKIFFLIQFYLKIIFSLKIFFFEFKFKIHIIKHFSRTQPQVFLAAILTPSTIK